ncbi:MAG: light-harvesting protein [Pseudomonadota bacterium]
MASDTPVGADSMSGITPHEAQVFHKYFVLNFIALVGIALIAHLLVWVWRPWIPGENGYVSLQEATFALNSLAQIPMLGA